MWFPIYLISGFMLLSSACTPASGTEMASGQLNTNPPTASPPTSTTEATPPEPSLIFEKIFDVTNSLCASEAENSMFSITCQNGIASVSQNANRQGVDILLQRTTPVDFHGVFCLNITITSSKAKDVDTDQNQYGILLQDMDGTLYALRLHGQYYTLERWGEKNETLFNETYSPYLHPGEQGNQIQLSCADNSCDVYFNGQFSARYPLSLAEGLSAVGIFTTSDWNQQFGTVQFENLTIEEFIDPHQQSQSFRIKDSLTADHGTFSTTKLSGAFSDFTEDGFYFSSLIPYGYYAAKSDPALADVTVSTVVHMEIDPNSSSSRYAGLICRSSQDGMYMAVIRADGTYSIFRDTPRQPFALLAERRSDAILSGTSDNSLRLECIGDQIIFSINGTQVESLTDTRYGLHFGRAGLFTKAGGEPAPDAIIFKDLVIKEER